ncbi:fluoride efflux transporter CrcB [Pararhizobium mangrovi]|uniref:Fluoride-specific ion channel FluC n=1 Tax=Pararhizobium mangrovi TaxID=2590452 RepID=A0A506U8B0_9HYPH|nr:fluoride efflux transporter CrcB [Pararhizobium mangrovi]TPW29334.1 fluoride efflux transporter CrcB [Pararhizobium mangrovi]
MQYLLVALGGAIGASLRHFVGVTATRFGGPGFPWGTMTVNILGSFVMGVIVELVARRLGQSINMRLFLMTGLLGGFTTFSSFSLDTAFLWERGQGTLAAVYVVASVVAGIAALFGGLALIRSLT